MYCRIWANLRLQRARVLWRVAVLGLVGRLAVLTSLAAVEAELASDGAAKMPVVVAATANAAVKKSAGELAAYLGRISGAKFAVQKGDGQSGIAVGLVRDFPDLGLADALPDSAWNATERYLLRTHDSGVYVIGASDDAVAFAVWDLLHRLGYRQYFPTEKWEVIPRKDKLSVALDVVEGPHYAGRTIWFGYGTWRDNVQRYGKWCVRNRMQLKNVINSGHAYEAIISRNEAEFRANPEYYGLVGDKRRSTKFCIGNPAVRKLVVDDALRSFEKAPDLKSVSLDPSDGGGWCQCAECAALGSITDRQVTLGNEVAAAVAERFPGRFVCYYAYNEHSPPPSVPVAPNVIVSIATAFIKGGYTVDQLFDGWHRAKAHLGVREYYAVTTWDRDMPGRGRGGNTDYVRNSLTKFYANGARFISSESSDNWGPNGLGYYLASRILWQTNEAARVEAITDEFVTLCFGAAQAPMAEFYRLLDGKTKRPVNADLLGRMFGALREAYTLTDDPAVTARLDDLTGYMRYVELFRAYGRAKGGGWRPVPAAIGSESEKSKPERQVAFEELVRHIYRIRETHMVHSYGLARDVPGRDGSVYMPQDARFDAPEVFKAKASDEIFGLSDDGDILGDPLGEAQVVAGRSRINTWKRPKPITAAEYKEWIAAGVANNPLADFTPVAFSTDLVPARPLGLQVPEEPSHKVMVAGNGPGTYTRNQKVVYFWAAQSPFALEISVTAGLIYNNLGDTAVRLFADGDPSGQAADEALFKPDKTRRTVTLHSEYAGLHRVEWADQSAATRIEWPEGIGGTWPCSDAQPFGLPVKCVYFYVPKGTEVVGGECGAMMTVCGPDGNELLTIKERSKEGHFSVKVPAGADGKLWTIRDMRGGSVVLQTVPPSLAFDPAQLLLPQEVVEADAGARGVSLSPVDGGAGE